MNLINVGPRDLEAILAVAQHGSFRAAALALGVSQPAISARVQHAEDIFGVKLFNRTTRRVSVTRHGEQLVARAEQAMAELRALAQEFKDEARLRRGRVIVGATPSIAGSLLPGIIRDFRQRWPGIEVILRDDFLGRALDRVHMGEVDVAVTPKPEDDDRFECEVLAREEYLLVAPDSSPLVRRRTVTLAEAVRHPLLTLPARTATWEMLRRAYVAEGLPFQPAFETHNTVSVLALIKSGFGFSFMPVCILPMFNLQGLKTARVGPSRLYREVSITRSKGRAIQPATEAMIAMLKEGFRDRSAAA